MEVFALGPFSPAPPPLLCSLSFYLLFYSTFGILEDVLFLFPRPKLILKNILKIAFALGYGIKSTVISPICFLYFLNVP